MHKRHILPISDFYECKLPPERVWLTSDTHFMHKNIIKYCNRPFSLEEHDEELIYRWNYCVGKDDIIFHLGDFCFSSSADRIIPLLEKLNGHMMLITGNHDFRGVLSCKPAHEYFYNVMQAVVHVGKYHAILNHFPMLCYSGSSHPDKYMQLFGHVHSTPETYERLGDQEGDKWRMSLLHAGQYDVGVDNNDFAPVSFRDVMGIIRNRIE